MGNNVNKKTAEDKAVQVLGIRVFYGSNIYSYRPVIKMMVDLAPEGCVYTRELGEFNRKLTGMLPGLAEHHCSRGRPGGFLERLAEGTYLGHVTEHVALELCKLAGQDVIYGKTVRGDKDTIYEIIFEYVSEAGAVRAARGAVELVQSLLEDRAFDIDSLVREIDRAARNEYGPSTRAIIQAASRRRIPVLPVAEGIYQLGYGKHARLISATITGETRCIGVDLASDKGLCKKILKDNGLPVPPGDIALSEDQALVLAQRYGPRVALKPLDGRHGKGVSLNLAGEAEIRQAFRLARYYSSRILVEKYIPGDQYRLLVVGDRVVAAAKRLPAAVTGDGRLSISQLMDEVNRDPRRGEGHEDVLTRIRLDAVSLACLARQGLTPESIPLPGQTVPLRDSANISSGGTSVDVTESVHPDNAWLAVRAARLLGLDVAGIDMVAGDIASPPAVHGGAIIEVNAAPGLRMHTHPLSGAPRDVGGAIVENLFPQGKPSRVPVVAVTGTNGKTTTARMIGALLAGAGQRVGLATSDGIYICGRRVIAGDTTGPVSARTVLKDPGIDVAVLETARGGILRGGLGYQDSDIGIVTNVSADHLGQNGVHSLQDLADVKSLVLETVSPSGYAVMNADDPLVLAMAGRVRSKIIYFSRADDNITVRRHLGAGGTAVFVKRGMMVAARGQKIQRLAPVKQMPSTLGGVAGHNVQNALAAAAACLGLGLDAGDIREGLLSFICDMEQNPGRMNIMDIHGIRVVIDYAHNQAGYESMLPVLRRFKSRLMGVVGVPGDRLDEQIKEVGRIAGKGFHTLYIKEDADLRGRKPGEVASLIRAGALEAGMSGEKVRVVLSEGEAVLGALKDALPGDTVAIFYEKLDTVLKALHIIEGYWRDGKGKSTPASPVNTGS